MSRWFRFYDDAVNDPKLLRLSDDLYRAWTILLCFASKNEGVLPPADDIAVALRIKPSKVCEWITKLVKGGLIDDTGNGFAPHNWNGRQYKSDVSTERVKRFRKRERNVSETASETAPETEQKQTTEQIDKIGDAGASGFTAGSKALASAFWKALGFESQLQIPPEFAGVDWRAIGWETAGWTVDLVETEARRVGPDKPLTYHEKVFATTFAKRQAPLPIVAIREAETLTVTSHAKPKSAIIQAADDLCRKLASFDGPAREPDELRSDQGEASPRLLSHG